jgi:hypothetical protein
MRVERAVVRLKCRAGGPGLRDSRCQGRTDLARAAVPVGASALRLVVVDTGLLYEILLPWLSLHLLFV